MDVGMSMGRFFAPQLQKGPHTNAAWHARLVMVEGWPSWPLQFDCSGNAIASRRIDRE
jgi:hypothetical protein